MVTNEHYRWDFIGLSTDTKPTPATSEKVVDGSTFYCSDTSKLYVYCRDNWYERKALGGGGGTSYTAGNGIVLNDDTISVDTDVIQEKLTAGDNITIENGTISAAGSSVNVVQTTGNSTTDVMSQDATTKMIFNTNQSSSTTVYPMSNICIGKSTTCNSGQGVVIGEAATISSSTSTDSVCIGHASVSYAKNTISIGSFCRARGDNSISIGRNAGYGTSGSQSHNVFIGGEAGNSIQSDVSYSVALGENAIATRKGEVNVGAGSTTNGFNNTSYRVLGGVHDGQDAHDVVTVEQVNATIDAINTALSTSIPHIGATS